MECAFETGTRNAEGVASYGGFSLTQACYVGAKKRKSVKAAADRAARRALLDESGAEVGSLDPLELSPEGQDDVRCQSLVDVIPASRLRAGEYTFEAALEPKPGDPGAPL